MSREAGTREAHNQVQRVSAPQVSYTAWGLGPGTGGSSERSNFQNQPQRNRETTDRLRISFYLQPRWEGNDWGSPMLWLFYMNELYAVVSGAAAHCTPYGQSEESPAALAKVDLKLRKVWQSCHRRYPALGSRLIRPRYVRPRMTSSPMARYTARIAGSMDTLLTVEIRISRAQVILRDDLRKQVAN